MWLSIRKFAPILAIPLLACSSQVENVQGVSFHVKVGLSDAAREKLLSGGESIKIAAWYDGDRKYPGLGLFDRNAPFRDVYLGDQARELRPGEVAVFGPPTFSGREFSALRDGEYFVTLNVFSGRRVFSDNVLLDCDVPSGRSERFANAMVAVECRLVGESRREGRETHRVGTEAGR